MVEKVRVPIAILTIHWNLIITRFIIRRTRLQGGCGMLDPNFLGLTAAGFKGRLWSNATLFDLFKHRRRRPPAAVLIYELPELWSTS